MKKKWLWGSFGFIALVLVVLGAFYLMFSPGFVYSRLLHLDEGGPQPVETISLDLSSRIASAGNKFTFSGICPPGTPDKKIIHFRIIQYSTGRKRTLASYVINEKFQWFYKFPAAGLYSIQAVHHYDYDADETYDVSPVKFLFVFPRLGRSS